MAKIILSTPHGPYQTKIDTQVMDVEIQEVYNGVKFITPEGNRLTVSQRDSGFEITYNDEPPIVRKGVIS